MDGETLERLLVRAAVLLSPGRLLGEVVLPLLTPLPSFTAFEKRLREEGGV